MRIAEVTLRNSLFVSGGVSGCRGNSIRQRLHTCPMSADMMICTRTRSNLRNAESRSSKRRRGALPIIPEQHAHGELTQSEWGSRPSRGWCLQEQVR